MRHTAGTSALLFSMIGLTLAFTPGARVRDEQQDQFEERSVGRCAERMTRAMKTDRSMWVKELENTYGKITDAKKEEEYGDWFALVAGKNGEWRKDDAPNAQIGELFDRVLMRMELGPVPSIRRDEFMKYVKRILMQENGKVLEVEKEQGDEADKVFRVLDRDSDGELQREELTTKLQAERVRVDADGNGRVDKGEYRMYFRRRVTTGAEVLAKAADQGRGPDGKIKPGVKAGNGLPDWFNTLDTDSDSQVSLYEWRKGGKPAETYTEMDLNGDGLLTKDEYLRFLKQRELKKKDEEPPG